MEQQTIKLLVLTTCLQCKALQDMLADYQIPFEVTDVDLLDAKEREDLMARMAPYNPKKAFPVIFINGKAIIGFQKDVLLKELGTHKK